MIRGSKTKSTPQALLRPVFTVMAAMAMLTVFAAFAPARAETTAQSAAPAPSATMLDQSLDAVLVVRSADDDDKFLGSAFLWKDGTVAVTNAHVVGNAETVRLIDTKGRVHEGRVIGKDDVRDVAVIWLETGHAGLMPAALPALGDEVWALGAPLGIDFTVTRGMVSARARQVDAAVPILFLQHDAAVNPGSSGGPLVDAQGRVVGMNSRIADGSRHYVGISYAISAPDLERIVEGLIAETLIPFPRLGLQLRPVSREIGSALGLPAAGILIDRVLPGELADKSGLMAGDILLAANGAMLHGPGDLAFAIDAALEAGEMTLTILRAGADLEISLSFEPSQTTHLTTRGLEGAAPLTRVSSYRLEALGLKLGEGGRIDNVTENSPGLFAGIIRGDRILAVNGKALDDTALAALDLSAPALILIGRAGGMTLHVILDPWDKGDGMRSVGGANVLDPAVVVF
jgi:serine protease Do